MSKSKKPVVALLAVLVILLAGGNLLQYKMSSDTIVEKDFSIDSLYQVSAELNKEITDFEFQIKEYQGENEALDKLLQERNQELTKRKKRIDQLLKSGRADKATIAALRKESKDLRAENQKLIDEIDHYITENQNLKKENSNLYKEVSKLESEKSALNNQVNIASVLKAEYVQIKPMRQRMLTETFKETSLAKRASKFDICFNVLENKITPKGKKTFYVSIIAPDEKTIGDTGRGSGTFNNPKSKEEIFYTAKTEVDFDGSAIENVCVSYNEEAEGKFAPGTYFVKIFMDGVLTKMETFELR